MHELRIGPVLRDQKTGKISDNKRQDPKPKQVSHEGGTSGLIEVQVLPLSKLVGNTGQIEGLPKNPRIIRDEKFAKLKKSIEDDPEMLELRELLVYPHGDRYVVIGGNMRLRAMIECGHREAPCKVLDKSTPVAKLRAYATKDNVPFGEFDWDALANEWDADELGEWGLDLPVGQDFSDKNKEVDTDAFSDESTIKLVYTLSDYEKVREALSMVAATPEQAVWKLLNL